MTRKITVSLHVEVEDDAPSTQEEIAERIRGSVAELVKSGSLDLGPEDTLASWRTGVVVGPTLAERLAETASWNDLRRAEAIHEGDARTEEEIAEQVDAHQNDMDWMIGQEEQFQNAIMEAREETGIEGPVTEIEGASWVVLHCAAGDRPPEDPGVHTLDYESDIPLPTVLADARRALGEDTTILMTLPTDDVDEALDLWREKTSSDNDMEP